MDELESQKVHLAQGIVYLLPLNSQLPSGRGKFELASLCLWSCKDPGMGMIILRDVCEYARGGSGMMGKKAENQEPEAWFHH